MRLIRWTCASAAVVLVGLAARPVQADPAVLYVPTEDVELLPGGVGECSGFGGGDNSGLGCSSGVDAPEVVPPWGEAEVLRQQLGAALAAYDVHIAEERPPEYLAYTMLLASDEAQPRSQGFTCSAGGINCGARKRNDIVRVFGPTQNCVVSDVLLASLYALGRASGLEGVADPLDAMHYVPDYAMGSGAFVDACSAIVPQIGFDDMGMQVQLPLDCPSIDHPGCAAGQQNGHAELLAVYGPRTEDEDPPVLTNLQPGDGSVFPAGGEFVIDVDIDDADPVVGGRWTVTSPVLEEAGYEGGVLTICTNDVCDSTFTEATPLKPTDSDWSIAFAGIPEGVFEIMFEAADFHGNVAEPVVMIVYVGDGPPGETDSSGGWESGLDGFDSGDGITTGMSGTTVGTSVGTGSVSLSSGGGPGDGSSEGEGTGTGEPEDDNGLVEHGCACATSGSSGRVAPWAILGVGFWWRRRRGATRAGR
jgi:hypothetical protein